MTLTLARPAAAATRRSAQEWALHWRETLLGGPEGWVWFSLVCAACTAASTALVHVVARQAAGSGIPEMKSVLTGILFHRFLGFRTFVTKFFGLILAESAPVRSYYSPRPDKVAACERSFLGKTRGRKAVGKDPIRYQVLISGF